ncbi:MAG: transglutaminase family protein, partial [Herminiimonas sp.]|nr:transglutaminase family protein [Herminiimonas sp.]
MVRLKFSIELNYQVYDRTSDFIFNIQAANTARQTIVSEVLNISQPVAPLMYTDPLTASRYLRLEATNGPLNVRYDATVDIEHHVESTANLIEMPIFDLPPEALTYIYPSRYCQSDRLQKLANREFGHLEHGYSRVAAIQNWVRGRTQFLSGSSDSSTSAVDTVTTLAGVCRDFAHLMIALCRAL